MKNRVPKTRLRGHKGSRDGHEWDVFKGPPLSCGNTVFYGSLLASRCHSCSSLSLSADSLYTHKQRGAWVGLIQWFGNGIGKPSHSHITQPEGTLFLQLLLTINYANKKAWGSFACCATLKCHATRNIKWRQWQNIQVRRANLIVSCIPPSLSVSIAPP